MLQLRNQVNLRPTLDAARPRGRRTKPHHINEQQHEKLTMKHRLKSNVKPLVTGPSSSHGVGASNDRNLGIKPKLQCPCLGVGINPQKEKSQRKPRNQWFSPIVLPRFVLASPIATAEASDLEAHVRAVRAPSCKLLPLQGRLMQISE